MPLALDVALRAAWNIERSGRGRRLMLRRFRQAATTASPRMLARHFSLVNRRKLRRSLAAVVARG